MTSNNKENPLLIGQAGPLEGQRWVINTDLQIGRDPECDIVIPLRQVSRHHTKIFLSSEGVMVTDLGSKNGTFVNRQFVEEPLQLKDGDELQISLAQDFIFLSSDATMPLDDLPFELQKRRLRVDTGARRVWVMDIELDPPLSSSQFNLLLILYEQSGEVVSRPAVIESVWSKSAEGVSEQALDALVRRLRDRIAEVDPSWEYIVTVRGHGLRLDNPPEPNSTE